MKNATGSSPAHRRHTTCPISRSSLASYFRQRGEYSLATGRPVRARTVAGPVIDKAVVTTNLPWVMDEDSLATDLNLKSVRLMNDLEAVARAIPILRETDVVTLNIGEPVLKTTIGVVAPGTGLGESFLTWDGSLRAAKLRRRSRGFRSHGKETDRSTRIPAESVRACQCGTCLFRNWHSQHL